MWWNFVGRSHEEIERFRQEWQEEGERFGRVEGYQGATQRLPRRSCRTCGSARARTPRRRCSRPHDAVPGTGRRGRRRARARHRRLRPPRRPRHTSSACCCAPPLPLSRCAGASRWPWALPPGGGPRRRRSPPWPSPPPRGCPETGPPPPSRAWSSRTAPSSARTTPRSTCARARPSGSARSPAARAASRTTACSSSRRPRRLGPARRHGTLDLAPRAHPPRSAARRRRRQHGAARLPGLAAAPVTASWWASTGGGAAPGPPTPRVRTAATGNDRASRLPPGRRRAAGTRARRRLLPRRPGHRPTHPGARRRCAAVAVGPVAAVTHASGGRCVTSLYAGLSPQWTERHRRRCARPLRPRAWFAAGGHLWVQRADAWEGTPWTAGRALGAAAREVPDSREDSRRSRHRGADRPAGANPFRSATTGYALALRDAAPARRSGVWSQRSPSACCSRRTRAVVVREDGQVMQLHPRPS